MPVSTPRSARDSWGEEMAEDVSRWVREIAREEAVPRDEYREVLSRQDRTETRLEGLSERVGRVGRVEVELRDTRREINERFDRMNGRFDRMNERFDTMHEAMWVQTRWTIGTIALIGIILSALLAIAEFAA